jgi:uncharacterized protein (DUF1015 family)
MAHILPFRGVLYNSAAVGAVRDLVAPPYDVIDAEAQAALYTRHSNNVIRLELGQDQPNDGPSWNRYTRAADFLRNWLDQGVLQRDPEPALYPYSIEYPVPSGDPRSGTRVLRGFLSLVELAEFGTGRIYPHENTRSAAKEDRFKLIEACRANFSPIFSLFSDPDGRVLHLLDRSVNSDKPRIDFTDDAGLRHRLWAITAPHALKDIVAAIQPASLFIADGHHRYETALAYRNSRRQQAAPRQPAGLQPYDSVLMLFSSLEDEGLTILPTHRVIPAPLPSPPTEIRRRLNKTFSCESFPFTEGTELEARTRFLGALYAARASNAHVMGFVVRGAARYDLLALNEAGLAQVGPSVRERLDVSILQRLVLREAIGMTPQDEERLLYTKSEEEALAAVAKGEGELAILLNPPKVSEVKEVATAGDRMPHKSTYFYPKPLTGLVINVME